MKTLKRASLDSKTLIEHEVEESALKSAVELVRLEEERKLLQGRKGEVEATLTEMGESEARVRAHRTYAGYWLGFSIVTVVIAVLTAWWSVSWYQTLGWEKALIAGTIVGLPLVGWTVFLKLAPELAPQNDLKRVCAGLGLVIVLSSLAAGIFLAAGRMVGTNFAEERATPGGQVSEDLDQAPEVRSTADRADRVKRLLAIALVVSVIFLGIASEIAAGIAVHEYIKRMTVVRSVAPLWAERQDLGDRLAGPRTPSSRKQCAGARSFSASGARSRRSTAKPPPSPKRRRRIGFGLRRKLARRASGDSCGGSSFRSSSVSLSSSGRLFSLWPPR